MAEGTDTRARSADAIVFDLVLLGFVGAVVAASLTRLSPEARLVPLIIGVPTLVGVTVQLLRDLFPGAFAALGRRSPAGRGSSADEITSGDSQPGEPGPARDGVARRKIVFSAWVVAFFILSVSFGFLVSIPVALVFFFRVVAREGWILTLSLTVGTWAFVWLLFGVLLNVDL